MFRIALLFLMLASTVTADQIVITGTVREGSFRGFEGGKFEFATGKGRPTKYGITQVSKLSLDKPLKVRLIRKDGKEAVEGEWQLFERGAFQLKQGDKVVSVPATQLLRLEDWFDTSLMPQAAAAPGGRGQAEPTVDTAALLRGELTAEQRGAVERYSAAREKLNAFIKESSAMQSGLDSATGAQRIELLNQLRTRQVAEQPLRNELRTSYQVLKQQFPQL